MTISRLERRSVSLICAIAIALSAGLASSAPADPPSGQPAAPAASDGSTEPPSLPQDGLFSSIKQSIREGDRDVVRGHFDLGTEPNVHRYYCLVDPKTGRREPNGVLGDPLPRADGMTGIKSSAVSLYTCSKAEARGFLVTTGYVLNLPPGHASAPPVASQPPQAAAPAAASLAAPAAASMPQPAPVPMPPPPAVMASPALDKIDVAGVRLGMSPEEVRAVLKSKKLAHNKEWTETLSYLDAAKGAAQPIANGRFVNVIAAWTAPVSAGGEGFEADGESFEVMFTPVPGNERAMAIVHSQGYSLANAIHETALESGLAKKYGGFAAGSDLPEAATWRFQNDGSVQIGDACNRRGTFGGLGGLAIGNAGRENIALKRTPEEFRSQVERCGDTIVTEDHFTANGGSLPGDRLVTRFTVSAYSPAIGYEGAKKAAQSIQGAAHSVDARAKDKSSPDL